MKTYEGANIRNVAVMGHATRAKPRWYRPCSTLPAATPRLGRVDDGSDRNRLRRRRNFTADDDFGRYGRAEWGKTKINLIDTPGFNMFMHEAEMVMPAVEAALVVVDAVSGVQVVTEDLAILPRSFRCRAYCVHAHGPRTRRLWPRDGVADQRHSDARWFRCNCPSARKRTSSGVVDLVKMKAYNYEMGGNGKAHR